MKGDRSKDLVALAAFLGACGLGGFLFLRARGALGETWSDGARELDSETGRAVRHAVWDAPEVLADLGEGADPAVSSDGRLLVFASGARGLNADLFVAELGPDGFEPAVPLAEINTPADEFAPAFSGDALWFASDRPGGSGGLDLWRVPLEGGRFGVPEPLGPGLNSPADETDPAPRPGAVALVFASDRAGAGFDLYEAELDADGFFAPVAVDALNSAADEREPAFAPDARSLYFASDRAAAGAFALLRAYRFQGAWETPEGVPLRSPPPVARGPWPAADGFTLYFESSGGEGRAALARARSLELLRLPPPPITLAQWLTLVALILLALLALLAKRWHALDVLYKCLLVSLILHLLLMLYLRTVVPDPPQYETGTGEGPTFRVRLAPSERDGTLEARLGPAAPSAPERASFASESAVAARPSAAELAAPEREAEPAPERGELASAADATPSPELAEREAAVARNAASAPALALSARASEAPAETADGGPERAEAAETARAELAPAAAELERVDASASELQRGSARATELARAETGVSSPELAAPAEALERASGSAPALALDAAGAAAPESASAPLAREHFDGSAPAAQAGPAAPAVAALERVAASAGELARGADRASSVQRGAASVPSPALAAPAESVARSGGSAPELALSAAASDADRGATEPALERGSFVPRSTEGAAAAPRADAGALAQSLDVPREDGAAPERARLTASGAASAPDVVAELRGPSDGELVRANASRPEFDATGGFQPAATEAGPDVAFAPPVRATSERASSNGPGRPSAPSPALLAGARGAPDAGPAPAPERSRAATGDSSTLASAPELRAPASAPAAAPPARPAPAFDAIAGLGAAAATRAEAAPAAPARATLATPAPDSPARPAPAALALPAPERARPPDAAPPRLAETPYQNRFGEQKLRALEEFGGSAETEHAVAAGLAYLARIQGEDGAWGDRDDRHAKYLDVRVGKSALALLAFLGAGHVPGGATEHAGVAEKAVVRLLEVQDGETGHFGQTCSYSHGIATYALAECFALTRDERLREPLERAVAEILRHQSDVGDPRLFGGWGYYYADGRVWNGDEWPRTSVTAWQVMALESARLGGLAVPDEAFAGAREFLVNTWDARRGAFRYDHDPERLSSGYPILPASTPAAIFALALLGVDPASPELAPARRFVLTRAPDGYRYTGDDDFVERARGNHYFWYYATLAMFRVGGEPWEAWNAALKETLLPAQEPDGSWRPIDTYADYAGDDDAERTYTTAMCVLSLEVYYRYFTPLLQVR